MNKVVQNIFLDGKRSHVGSGGEEAVRVRVWRHNGGKGGKRGEGGRERPFTLCCL